MDFHENTDSENDTEVIESLFGKLANSNCRNFAVFYQNSLKVSI